jgi:hypothetical protein
MKMQGVSSNFPGYEAYGGVEHTHDVMAGLVPAIHVFDAARLLRRGCPAQEFTLGPAEGRTRVPGMTTRG